MVCSGALFATVALAGAAPAPRMSSVPLNQWPMIMSHDAATSYYSKNACEGLATAVGDFVMTQSPGQFSDQLDSGARAFDFRPYMKDGELLMHHGGVVVNVAVKDGLQNIKAWSAQNSAELVLVYGSHCTGKSSGDKSGCEKAFEKELSDAGVPLIPCSDIAGMTVGDALARGSVVATWGCMEENYDSSIKCYGDILLENSQNAKEPVAQPVAQPVTEPVLKSEASSGTFVCYGSNKEKAFDALWKNLEGLSNVDKPPHQGEATLWMVQAHWQYDVSSVAQGTLHGSCILKDESKASVNQQIADKIKAGDFKHLNVIEVDNVHDNGQAILAALRSRFTNDLVQQELV